MLSKRPALFEAVKKSTFYSEGDFGTKVETADDMISYAKVGEHFIRFLEGNTDNKSQNKERIEKEILLSKKKMTLENLEKSVETIQDGAIPASILKMLMNAEEEVSRLKEELEELTVNSIDTKTTLHVKTVDEFVELFKKEHGRLQIINFLASNGITFFFTYNKDAKTLNTKVAIDGEVVSTYNTMYEINALEKYGIGNIAEEFKLPDA
jgi:cyclophilin family peptidyl-prolyl cis-trans isomerase